MTSGKWMPEIIFFPFLLVWVNDTFAYLSGSLLGKHKLFPRISPKKSWEGAIGGGLMTIIVGLCVSPYIEGVHDPGYSHYFVYRGCFRNIWGFTGIPV